MSKSFYQLCEAVIVFFKVLTGKSDLLDGKKIILKSNTVTPILIHFWTFWNEVDRANLFNFESLLFGKFEVAFSSWPNMFTLITRF